MAASRMPQRGLLTAVSTALSCVVVGLGALAVASAGAAPSAEPPRGNVFDITAYGALGDGHTVNTAAIVKAVGLAAAASAAGPQPGVVLVPSTAPSGTVFVTGAFNLSSHVTLHVAAGAVLRASDDGNDFLCLPVFLKDTGPCDYPLVTGVGIQGVTITGGGTIDGGANNPPGHLVASYNATNNFLHPVSQKLPGCPPDKPGTNPNCRVKLVEFRDCHDITVSGVFLRDSSYWTLVFVNVTEVLVEKATITGDRRWPNNDALDIVDCVNVTVRDSAFSTGDDCICLSTHVPNLPVRNVTVEHVSLQSTSAAAKLGHFSLSDMEDVIFTDINITDSHRGFAIMPRVGGGNVRNVTFSNSYLEARFFSLEWWGNGEAIYVSSMSAAGMSYTGTVSDITVRNVSARSENANVLALGDSSRSAGSPSIDGVTVTDVDVVIAHWSNVTVDAYHDCRPHDPPELVPALVNGGFAADAARVSLADIAVAYDVSGSGGWQPFWSPECVNATAADKAPVACDHCSCRNTTARTRT